MGIAPPVKLDIVTAAPVVVDIPLATTTSTSAAPIVVSETTTTTTTTTTTMKPVVVIPFLPNNVPMAPSVPVLTTKSPQIVIPNIPIGSGAVKPVISTPIILNKPSTTAASKGTAPITIPFIPI